MIRMRDELLPLNMLVIVLIGVILLYPSSILRIILGLPLVVFFPGYTLVAALFVKRGDLDGIERVALSFGLSIAVVPLIGLGLNSTSWGIRLEPVVYSVALFIFVMSTVSWFRRRRSTEQERFVVGLQLKVPGWSESTGARQKILSGILALSILGTLGTFGYTLASPRVGERYTEFYVLGLDGNAMDYPKEIELGGEGRVIMGIVNHEHEVVTYEVKMLIEGVESANLSPVTLEHDEEWENVVSFAPSTAGAGQTVDFLLYREGLEDAYRSLRLWVDVIE